MKKIIILAALTILMICAACGSKTENPSTNKTISSTSENKSSTTSTSSTTTSGAASTVVKNIYDNAMKQNCAAIPPMLTEEFRKEVGTSKDALDALCDTFTDSGKLTSFEVKSEDLKGDSGTVKVALTFKDGKKEDKNERVKKSGNTWLMGS